MALLPSLPVSHLPAGGGGGASSGHGSDKQVNGNDEKFSGERAVGGAHHGRADGDRSGVHPRSSKWCGMAGWEAAAPTRSPVHPCTTTWGSMGLLPAPEAALGRIKTTPSTVSKPASSALLYEVPQSSNPFLASTFELLNPSHFQNFGTDFVIANDKRPPLIAGVAEPTLLSWTRISENQEKQPSQGECLFLCVGWMGSHLDCSHDVPCGNIRGYNFLNLFTVACRTIAWNVNRSSIHARE